MKKIMISTLVAAASLVALAGQAHAGTTLDAVKKKALCNVASVMGYLASLMQMQAENSPALTLMFVVVWLRPSLVMQKK